jgi:hypothetical protein
MEEVERNYSSAMSSLPHRRHRQENQAAEELRSYSTAKVGVLASGQSIHSLPGMQPCGRRDSNLERKMKVMK